MYSNLSNAYSHNGGESVSFQFLLLYSIGNASNVNVTVYSFFQFLLLYSGLPMITIDPATFLGFQFLLLYSRRSWSGTGSTTASSLSILIIVFHVQETRKKSTSIALPFNSYYCIRSDGIEILVEPAPRTFNSYYCIPGA